MERVDVVGSEALARAVSGAGYEVERAADPESLAAPGESSPLTVVVVDLPAGADPAEWLARIRTRSKRYVPVFALDAKLATDGVPAFLVRPVRGEEIRPRIEQARAARAKEDDQEVYVAALENRLNTRTEEVVISRERLRQQHIEIVNTLQRVLQARHVYTEGHSRRVAKVAAQMARAMGLKGEELRVVELGAIFHDIGKIGVRDEVLNKPGTLSEVEYDHMKTHPIVGEQILSVIHGFERVVDIVKHEHERWDGKGYPDMLAGEKIPMGARIVSVADAWDSMVFDRAYRRAIPRDKAIEEVRQNAGSQFDPTVVNVFISLYRKEPAI